MAKPTSEVRQFKMHQKLLYDVIRRQAGTLSKAILEAVMNAVDAKATGCQISITASRVTISDDGQGFRSREEIEQWFEVFGQPHEESEGKTYGTFRMGRGQLFAFGVNTWTTNKFQMDIDIQNKGLDYELQTVSRVASGCLIEIALYDRLMPSAMAETIQDLEHWVKWCPIPVTLNDEVISTDPATVKWDTVTDEAYIRLKPHGSLAVYNLGIHVFDLPGYKYGTGGEVVSRKQVKVNFARNDIQSDCKVWAKVKQVVDQKAATKVAGKKALNDDERQRLVDRLLSGHLPFNEGREMRLVTAATGRQYTLREMSHLYQWKQLTNAPKGNRKADKLMKGEVAFVVADETLDRFRVKNLTAMLKKLDVLDEDGQVEWTKLKVTPFADLTKGMSEKYDVIDEADWTSNEMLWMRLISKGTHRLSCEDEKSRYRRLCLGESKTANGWTDGDTYICIDKKFLGKLNFNFQGFVSVGRLMLHELCHHSPDIEDHDHDQAFYEEFHDHSDSIGDFATTLMACLPSICESLKKKLTKHTLVNQDQQVRMEEAIAKFPNVRIRKP